MSIVCLGVGDQSHGRYDFEKSKNAEMKNEKYLKEKIFNVNQSMSCIIYIYVLGHNELIKSDIMVHMVHILLSIRVRDDLNVIHVVIKIDVLSGNMGMDVVPKACDIK